MNDHELRQRDQDFKALLNTIAADIAATRIATTLTAIINTLAACGVLYLTTR